jgi:hypothetical protein
MEARPVASARNHYLFYFFFEEEKPYHSALFVRAIVPRSRATMRPAPDKLYPELRSKVIGLYNLEDRAVFRC